MSEPIPKLDGVVLAGWKVLKIANFVQKKYSNVKKTPSSV